MSFPSPGRPAACLTGLILSALAAAGCTPAPSVGQSWTGPGWYLQKSYIIAPAGPVYFGGPYTYAKCEEERAKQPPETASQMLCTRENRKPDRFARS
ncbi:hypothetical protein [Reyranella sp.]|uniref:hypothetical protein n=1 Tax=Reyranella sp. TaxID=1929291 RepID=UPI003BAA6101